MTNRFVVFPRNLIHEYFGPLDVVEHSADSLYFGIAPNWCTKSRSLCTLNEDEIIALHRLLTEFIEAKDRR
jgi:hypothetical protein